MRAVVPEMAGVASLGELACPETSGAVVKWMEAFPSPLIL